MWMKSLDGDLLPKFDGPKSEAYHYFFKKANERFNFYFAFGFESHQNKGIFTNLFIYDGQGLAPAPEASVEADVIYHYQSIVRDNPFDPGNARIVNSPAFKQAYGDKYLQYQRLEKFFPKTTKPTSKDEVAAYLKNFNNEDIVVLKPCRGSSGVGVVVSPAGEVQIEALDQQRLETGGYLGQDFLDTSSGIPGITTGTHDLRIMTMVDTVVLCHVRTPPENSLIGNTHKGAAMDEVHFENLPKEIQDFYHAVHAEIKKDHPEPLYSLDLGLTPSGPFLFEINTHTAFPRKDFSVFESFIATLLDVLDR